MTLRKLRNKWLIENNMREEKGSQDIWEIKLIYLNKEVWLILACDSDWFLLFYWFSKKISRVISRTSRTRLHQHKEYWNLIWICPRNSNFSKRKTGIWNIIKANSNIMIESGNLNLLSRIPNQENCFHYLFLKGNRINILQKIKIMNGSLLKER